MDNKNTTQTTNNVVINPSTQSSQNITVQQPQPVIEPQIPTAVAEQQNNQSTQLTTGVPPATNTQQVAGQQIVQQPVQQPNPQVAKPAEQEIQQDNKSDKLIRKVQFIALLGAIIFLVWYFVISPTITFKRSEKIVEAAGKDYFNFNSSQLPTGTRTATVTLQELFHKAYIKEDIYIPNTKEPCSLKDSWVKVRREDGEYKYYTYLKCGSRESDVDHEGPELILNGEKEITIGRGEEYKEPGIKSVKDNVDGTIDTEKVTIKDSALNTNQIGKYEISYIVADSLSNKTTVVRKINVIEKLRNTVLTETEEKGYYTGKDPKNYLYFSSTLYRIIGIDGENIKIVALEDVANVNYDGINEWLEYYYDHLTDEAKKLIVKNKYCNMSVTEDTYTTTECSSYTDKINAYIPSVTDINLADTKEGNYLKPLTISWTANEKDQENAFAVRNIFYGTSGIYYPDTKITNYGVRPVLTIKGDVLLKKGTGTRENPYYIGETPQAKADDKINTRHSGEYIEYSGVLWRIVEVNKDGTTKIVSNKVVKKNGDKITTFYDTPDEIKQYNPKQNGNVGYYINNKVSEYIETSYFVNKEVKVPIYEKDILYKKEVSTKKYKVKLSAPNMYEMYSAFSYDSDEMKSYWLINSSKEKYYKSAITDIGVVLIKIGDYDEYGVRVVGNLSENIFIVKGKGTKENPYHISK